MNFMLKNSYINDPKEQNWNGKNTQPNYYLKLS